MAGGSGSRLYPLTRVTNKHLLPVANKPMIYYSISTLLLSGARRIFLVTTPSAVEAFETLLYPMRSLGLDIKIIVQKEPGGIAEGIKICQGLISTDKYLLMLGDNFFYGPHLSSILMHFANTQKGCSILCYHVKNPKELGVAKIDQGVIVDIIEKPSEFVGHNAITGLYSFDEASFEFTGKLKRSSRKELEITDLLKCYLHVYDIEHTTLNRGFTWFDLGTLADLEESQSFVNAIQSHQGYFVGCIEEVLLKLQIADRQMLARYVANLPKSEYQQYLDQLS